VATRWITFLGIAIAGTGFLFGQTVLRNGEQPVRYLRLRACLILGGALAALLASLAEPVLQALYPPENVELDLISAIAGLPAAWWFRPVCLGITAGLAVVLTLPLLGRLPGSVAWSGAVVSLLALAGLSLTSHAAGRETWQLAATLSNVIHQVSVALWTGGLVHLALWWPFYNTTTMNTGVVAPPLRRFSTIALPLFALALVTGLINTGFMFPLIAGIEEYGVTTEAFATLWTSNYGYVLLLKLLILVVPLVLAVYHRAVIAKSAGALTTRLGTRVGRTLRIEGFMILAVVLGGSVLALSAPPVLQSAPLEEVILAAPAYSPDGAMSDIVHLTIDPAAPGENTLALQVTDLQGNPLPNDPLPTVSLGFTSVEHDGVNRQVSVPVSDPTSSTFAVEGLALSLNGWWNITATIEREGQKDTQARIYLLLPDPNLNGFDAPADLQTSPEARAVFDRGLQAMTSWTSVRALERIASGSDALVMVEREVTTGGERQPAAHVIVVTYSAGFAPLASGEPPAPPQFVSSYSITIGDQGWQRHPNGSWLEAPPTRASLPSEWGSIYVGADNFQLGATTEFKGEPVQIVTFHTPEQPSQTEAWFAWWVGMESGNVYQVAMVAQQHYMLWEYSNFNETFSIEKPSASVDP
jgi:putative copper export protein